MMTKVLLSGPGPLLAPLACLVATLPLAAADLPPALQGVKLEPRLNFPVPLDLEFRNEQDETVRLRDLFRPQKPVILVLAYFRCPMLCNMVLNGTADGLRDLARQRGFRPGDEFDVIVVSFDPQETPEMAAAKKESLLEYYGVPGASEYGWHFLTGRERSIRTLTQAVSFRYRYDYATGQYAHASGILVLTPAGRISRVFHGVEYDANDLYYGLVEASNYRIGRPVRDRVVTLFCYSYDPDRGTYQMRVINVVRSLGVLTVLGIALLIWRLRRAELRRAAGDMPVPARPGEGE